MASSFLNGIPYELSLGLKLSYVPKSLPDLINDLRKNDSIDEDKLLVLNDYLLKCQEELFYVGVFKQELLQCRLTILEGMELLKEEIKRIKKGMGLDVAVESAMDPSATEKNRSLKLQGLDLNNPFIDHEQQWSKPPLHHDERQEATTNKTASFFLDPPPRPEKVPIDLNLRANRRTMMDFKRRPLTQPTWVNNRRSWTPELHTRFVVVLHMLGGPEATPKQIRDLMQVDGLTNNQVKSHLQKYRSYWRTYPDAIADDLQMLKSYLGDVAEPNGAASGIAPGNID